MDKEKSNITSGKVGLESQEEDNQVTLDLKI